MLTFACGGCNQFLSQFAGPAPQVNGRWIGRLVDVKVSDNQGRVYDATALAIQKGPRLPEKYREVWEGTEAARTPLVVRTRTMPLLITDPTGLPIGSRVEVSGTLLMGSFNAPLPSGIEGGGVSVSRTTATGDRLSHGPVVMLPAEGTAAIRAQE